MSMAATQEEPALPAPIPKKVTLRLSSNASVSDQSRETCRHRINSARSRRVARELRSHWSKAITPKQGRRPRFIRHSFECPKSQRLVCLGSGQALRADEDSPRPSVAAATKTTTFHYIALDEVIVKSELHRVAGLDARAEQDASHRKC